MIVTQAPRELTEETKQKATHDELVAGSAVATALLTAALAMIAGAQALLFWQQLRYMRSALKDSAHASRAAVSAAQAAEDANRINRASYLAAHRPWVKVAIEVGGPLRYDHNGLNLTVRFRFTNIGNSPALDVFPSTKVSCPDLSHLPEPGSVRSRQDVMKDAVEDAKRLLRSDAQLGMTIFPGDTVVLDMSVGIGREELDRITENTPLIVPHVYGAVGYRATFDEPDPQPLRSTYVGAATGDRTRSKQTVLPGQSSSTRGTSPGQSFDSRFRR